MVRFAKYKKEYNKSEFSADNNNNNKINNRSRLTGGVRKNQSSSQIVCLQCRKPGHKASSCPKRKGDEKRCCYRCGSTEHSLHDCDLAASTGMPFAKCFVCGGQGHLSGGCPHNPKGVYPNGGGCKVCGDVRHFVKNCPLKSRQEFVDKTEEFFSENDDDQKEKPKEVSKSAAVKVVEFK